MKLYDYLWVYLRNENPGYAYVNYHRSSEHCILMDRLTTRKEAKLLQSDTFPGLKNLSKLLSLPGLCPGPHWGSLQRSPDPVVAFNGRFVAGREKGRGREEKGGREGEGPPKVLWICQLGGELAPSLLGGIDAPASNNHSLEIVRMNPTKLRNST